jgi:hypothetical protein
MTHDDGQSQRVALVAQACMETTETIAPILDSAEGVKADMIGRGWGEGNAEQVATTYVQAMLKRVIEVAL